MGATYLGDFAEDAIVHHKCSTNDAGGAAIDPSVDGIILVYRDDGTSELTSAHASITYTVAPFDSKTGLIHVKINLAGHADFSKGHEYQVVLSAATVDGESVLAVLFEFSIENRFTQEIQDRLGAPAGASVSADIAAVAAKTDNLPADPAAAGDEMDLVNSPNATALAAIVAAIRAAIIDGVAWEDHVAITSAAAAGDLTGAAGNEVVIKQLDGAAVRITAATDQYGNRAITLTLPGS